MHLTDVAVQWAIFGTLVFGLLWADLRVVGRSEHFGFRQAALWTGIWIAVALAFNGYIFWARGRSAGFEFLTAYLVEKSLSVDNLFVFLAIFRYFRLGEKTQHRVLFWGVLGALIMRGIFVVAGAALLQRFDWLIYVLGVFLVATGLKMYGGGGGDGADLEQNPALRFARRYLRTTRDFVGDRFVVREEGLLKATPLLLVLIVVEFTDVLFAVDSVPAVLAISRDVFVVYTSNIFALLGLRAMFFVLAGLMDRFHYLGTGLAAILVFIGAKMLAHDILQVSSGISLGIIGSLLLMSVAASWIWPRTDPAPALPTPVDGPVSSSKRSSD